MHIAHSVSLRQGDLEDILSGDLEFTGAFSFHRAYPIAPNPALNIDGLGTIGLPLSARDAAAIKACAEQAPFGKVDQTIVDKTVRDTWEIDATKVTCSSTSYADGAPLNRALGPLRERRMGTLHHPDRPRCVSSCGSQCRG